MTEITEDAKIEPDDGFNVVDEVTNGQWANYDTEEWEEYIHVIIDRENRKLRCYRTTNEDFPSERVKTTIDNVRCRLSYDERDHDKTLRGFYLTWRQADTFLTFVDFMSDRREEGTVMRLDWYENNEKPAHEDIGVNDETISLTFTKWNDQERHVQIMDTWSAPSNQMAKYEDNQ